MTHHDQTLYRDSFYSGIGQENDWRQLEELDPDSLAGIHLYGDTSDLQPHALHPQQSSPAAPSSPLNKYPTYEHTPAPAPRNSDWQHERHLQQLQQQAILRQLQYPDDDEVNFNNSNNNNNNNIIDDDLGEEAKVQMATRHLRQRSHSQVQQLQFEQKQQPPRQLVSPPPTFIEKEKKAGRFSSRFSFLTRLRQPQHQRHDSVPVISKDPWLHEISSPGSLSRLNSLSHRRSGQMGATPTPTSPPPSGPGATTPIDEEQDLDGCQFREEAYPPKSKSNSRVKQLIKDVFGIKKKSQSSDLAFRDISLPSTHIRSSSSPLHHQQQQQYNQYHQHLDPSINSQYRYAAAVAQRKGLVTPVSRPDTAQSNYRNDTNNAQKNNRNRARESLVDPVQQLGFQKMEFGEDDGCADDLAVGGAFPEGYNTSLTPPPASSVLRHSSPPHRGFLNSNSGSGEYETPVLITAAVAGQGSQCYLQQQLQELQEQQQHQQQSSQPYILGSQELSASGGGGAFGGRTSKAARPPSTQMATTPKDYVDSGCDSTGGLEQPYTTASNATTLNPHQYHTSSSINNNNTTTKGGGTPQQQPSLYSSSSPQPTVGGGAQQQKSLSYDYDRAMTMSTYDNGPTIVAMAQVQKVDLEGLRQNHHHHLQHHHHHQQHSPPSHSDHLGMVAVESPFS